MDQGDLRIIHGDPTPEELAALIAVLTARTAAQRATTPRFAHGNRRPQARWRRLELVAGYRSPVSWR
ncbi:acyl-CoA carboxylase subunit epsilon [Streptomyces sp. NBC_00847]|uniref:acyl-CoA carboxylase subunit epsilon n=1 Tax=unclassified Streptomyces TaxID=2593676 RepID=UPI0022577BA7|nr:acyl-CoA carboxylase subunit epsilon [Streptomyces sp. NBC_00847]MCX4884024.1 acyl-CoA carboxylase subunit epsilon [Streptomyces sp. NBC_00847]